MTKSVFLTNRASWERGRAEIFIVGRQPPRQSAAPECYLLPDRRAGIPRTSALRRPSPPRAASCRRGKPRFPASLEESWEYSIAPVLTLHSAPSGAQGFLCAPSTALSSRQELNSLQHPERHFAVNHGKNNRDVDHRDKKDNDCRNDHSPHISCGICANMAQPHQQTRQQEDQYDNRNRLTFPYTVDLR
jgi:hypothetical protein